MNISPLQATVVFCFLKKTGQIPLANECFF